MTTATVGHYLGQRCHQEVEREQPHVDPTPLHKCHFCRYWIRNFITTVIAVITSHQPQCLFRPVWKFDLKRRLLRSGISREARRWWLQRAKGAAGRWIIPYIGIASSSVHWYLLRRHSCNCTLIDSRARTIKNSQTPAWPICGENKLNPANGT